MDNNQLSLFLDNLDASVHKHLVMFYEETEYARLVETRFLNDGLNRGECCVFLAKDDDDLHLTKSGMKDFGIDVEKFTSSGLLQFHLWKPRIVDAESYRKEMKLLIETVVNQFSSLHNDSASTIPKIRGVGTCYPGIFASDSESGGNKAMVASELLAEELFQHETACTLGGVWLCVYHVKDISVEIERELINELLQNHDAVMYLQKFSNDLALNLKQ